MHNYYLSKRCETLIQQTSWLFSELHLSNMRWIIVSCFFEDKSQTESKNLSQFLCFTGASGSRKGICPHSSAEQTGGGGLMNWQLRTKIHISVQKNYCGDIETELKQQYFLLKSFVFLPVLLSQEICLGILFHCYATAVNTSSSASCLLLKLLQFPSQNQFPGFFSLSEIVLYCILV